MENNYYGVIYRIINKINRDCYVGQTTRDINIRIKEHFRNYYRKDTYLYKAMSQYGIDNFEWEILDYVKNKIELDKKERHWIYTYHCYVEDCEYVGGYNLTNGGEGHDMSEESKNRMKQKLSLLNRGENNPNYGRKHSDEELEKMRQATKSRIISNETKIKMGISHKGLLKGNKNPMFGKKQSKEDINKRIEKRIITVNTSEYKEKIKNRIKSGITKKSKKVICIETNEIFSSVTLLKRKYKCADVVLYGKAKSYMGLHFKFVD